MLKTRTDIGGMKGMKMKRNILTILIPITLFGIALTSCKDRNDDNDKILTAEEKEKQSKVEAQVQTLLLQAAQAAKVANDAMLAACRDAKDAESHAKNAGAAATTANDLVKQAKDLIGSNPKIVRVNEVKAIELLAGYATWQAAIAEEVADKASQALKKKATVEYYKVYDAMRRANLEVLDIAKDAYENAKGNPNDLVAI
jgi:hypothetical protein